MNYREIAEKIFLAGVSRVKPQNLIPDVVTLENGILKIDSLRFILEEINNLYVIGAGKASALMGAEIEKIFGDRITDGHIVTKYGHSCDLKFIKISEAGHPVPDENGYAATKDILRIAHKAGKEDLVICLLSGGGSALLADYPENSSPEEVMKLNNLLINSGASISEINAVRKHLSYVKGGLLARTAYPAEVVSLILSDVIGDRPDVIASGPTAPDGTTFSDALDVLEKYGLSASVPRRLPETLKDGRSGLIPETPKEGDPIFEKVHNLLIGTNRIALEASASEAVKSGLNTFIIDDSISGDVEHVSDYIIETCVMYSNDHNVRRPVCLLFGGEPTIRMTGQGLGGRNQHLALLCAVKLANLKWVTILCAGTDGTDGPTDASGAVVDCKTVQLAALENIDPFHFINGFDSYNFFKRTGDHIITGPTMTNVMDIIVAIIE